ncbi:DUF5060 domain-containing protein [Litorilinea aerophila]|nr:DUF5060 domain-containing protein [Litorilinea aerophila]MCC9076572.1 DUF5060 domain-containing protein [Litorilinea aerophila]
MTESVEKWGIFELALSGPADGNPFTEVSFGARFRHKNRVVEPDGFYDGDGVYRVRFMPDTEGEWHYETVSNVDELAGHRGSFTCVPPTTPGNHGPVQVHNIYHFAYADGTPHVSVGTTCYAWVHQGDALEEQTLETLKQAPFNKMRMCVFPKHYPFNANEPPLYPYVRGEDGQWDFQRFNPAFFQHFETRVGQLRDMGIEADIILFHPYDRWGFATMPPEADDLYLRYVVARLAAYRNVWWSMANEFDLMKSKHEADWDRFFRIVQESDPYQHLRSIHNCRRFYDHGKPWVTHTSVQHSDLARVPEWREAYRKPVVVDECRYEGNIEKMWGNITAQEMVHRFWLGTIGGGYVGHGETYLHPEDILWWSKGGVLHGESPARIAFLRRLLEEHAPEGLDPVSREGASKGEDYYLFYFGVAQPGRFLFTLPEAHQYRLDVIDTWNMTITPVEGTYSGTFMLELPSKPFHAVQARRVDS